MTRRAGTVESTRERILEAALDLYRRQGIAATTVGQVAHQADVARATVLNHFGSGQGLVAGAVEKIASELQLPTAAIFAGATTGPERVRALVAAVFALYERSGPWFSVVGAELQSVAALRSREQQYWADMQQLYGAALGPLRRRRRLMATVVALTSPATFGALTQAGLSGHEAADVVGDLLAGLVE